MNVEISTDKTRLDVAMIHRFLAEDSYWVRSIERRDVECCIENSFCFGVYLDGEQVGFARLVTDFVRFAHLMDVFILPAHRGLGLSKLLMQQIISHPKLKTITRYSLGTSDAHGLYRQFGFVAPAHPERQMERLTPWPGA
jgi:GNAT superfamily N-acetyltransferase